MRISLSKNPAGEAWQQRYFSPVMLPSMRMLAKHMLSGSWSPIIWREGYRKSDNFLSCDFLVLDCDDGSWTLDSAKLWLLMNDYRGIIGTTKSHQIAKGGKPACDRFRVVVPWHETITNYDNYRANMEHILKTIPADKACKDGARFFYPCKKIEYFQDGKPFTWRTFPPVVRRPPDRYYSQNGVLPRFLRDMISFPPAEGSRNKHCFSVAFAMARYGFSEADAIDAVRSMNIGLQESEAVRAARNGYKSWKK